MQGYWEALWRDCGVYAFIASYLALAFLLSKLLAVPAKFDPAAQLEVWLRFLLQGFVVIASIAAARSIRAVSPVRAFLKAMKRLVAPDMVAGMLLVVALGIFLSVFGSVKAMLTDIVPFWADIMLARIDALLHGGSDPWMLIPRSAPLTRVIDAIYGPGWTLVLLSSIFYAALHPAARVFRAQYVWTFLLAWVLLGNVVAGMMMSAGPIYFEPVTGAAQFGALAKDVAEYAPWSSGVRHFLWRSYTDGSAGIATGISAFPSLHLSITTLFILQASRIHSGLKWVAIAFGCWIMASSVYLGWHYAVDGYFSILATLFIWRVVGWCLSARGSVAIAQTPQPAVIGAR